MSVYYRPILTHDTRLDAPRLAGGWSCITGMEALTRNGGRTQVALADVPDDIMARLTGPRAPVAGLTMGTPRLMGILNVTPDSFSDGGAFLDPETAKSHARAMAEDGVDILDIGGESTRPGADFVSVSDEIERTAPVISALEDIATPVSIDTRKAAVAEAALAAGAAMLNDVSAMSYDPEMARIAAQSNAPICLMHTQGDPATMQDAPNYQNVTLDVFDHLAERIGVAEAAGIPRSHIVVDPGIGFGKTLEHNLTLLRDLALFHSLGCPVLLGASRKKFIGTIGQADDARDRMPGSLAVMLHGISQGVQISRVHDTKAAKQALRLALAIGDHQ